MSAYRLGCRCPDAKEEKARYEKRRRLGRHAEQLVDATGSSRRLQALAALGWRMADICAQLGYAERSIPFEHGKARIRRRAAERIAKLYDELSMQLGPSDDARQRAARKGWPPPLAWDDIDDPKARPAGAVRGNGFDEVVVERAVRGERGNQQLRRADAQEAIRRCRALRMPVSEITWRVGVSDRTVHRNAPLVPVDTVAS